MSVRLLIMTYGVFVVTRENAIENETIYAFCTYTDGNRGVEFEVNIYITFESHIQNDIFRGVNGNQPILRNITRDLLAFSLMKKSLECFPIKFHLEHLFSVQW